MERANCLAFDDRALFLQPGTPDWNIARKELTAYSRHNKVGKMETTHQGTTSKRTRENSKATMGSTQTLTSRDTDTSNEGIKEKDPSRSRHHWIR